MLEKSVSPKGVYKFELPIEFMFEKIGESVSVFDEKAGSGAVNITSYDIPINYDFDMVKELRDFVNSIDANIESKREIMGSDYVFTEFISKGSFWKIWIFFKNQHALFASYNCDKKEKEKEIEKINKIVESLEIL